GPVLQDDDQAGVVCREMRSLAETYQTRRQARRSEERLLAVSEVLDLGLALGD
ncbi:MAG: hypothetical protein GWO24_16280, partial [Akkermansiaceae bacterium]|nr:hypothetical protein [Akkermansiaceae bacterium]